jgi:hypothetical protein
MPLTPPTLMKITKTPLGLAKSLGKPKTSPKLPDLPSNLSKLPDQPQTSPKLPKYIRTTKIARFTLNVIKICSQTFTKIIKIPLRPLKSQYYYIRLELHQNI